MSFERFRARGLSQYLGMALGVLTLHRVTPPPPETDDSAANWTTTLPAVVDMKREPRPR